MPAPKFTLSVAIKVMDSDSVAAQAGLLHRLVLLFSHSRQHHVGG
jgi:hypothetical protein